MLAECATVRNGFSAQVRERVHLLCSPMDDEEAGAVNALQRRADVVIQKSLAEGFGLVVSEAMWKARPVVSGRVGGIHDQIGHGKSGILADEPSDGAGFGRAVADLVAHNKRAAQMGTRARGCWITSSPRDSSPRPCTSSRNSPDRRGGLRGGVQRQTSSHARSVNTPSNTTATC